MSPDQGVACLPGGESPALPDARFCTGWYTLGLAPALGQSMVEAFRFRVLFKAGFYAWEMQFKSEGSWFLVPESGHYSRPVWVAMASWMITAPLDEVGSHCAQLMMEQVNALPEGSLMSLLMSAGVGGVS